MMTLFREGGFPMWFLLAFGLLLLVSGARFAMRPDRARLGRARPRPGAPQFNQ
jgi:uncharacterized membrane protein